LLINANVSTNPSLLHEWACSFLWTEK
jgi:hypothetical protein